MVSNNATTRILDKLAAKLGEPGRPVSDYRLAKTLGVAHNRISNYRHGRSQMDDVLTAHVAELLGVDGLGLIADIERERATERPAAVSEDVAHMVPLAAIQDPARQRRQRNEQGARFFTSPAGM